MDSSSTALSHAVFEKRQLLAGRHYLGIWKVEKAKGEKRAVLAM